MNMKKMYEELEPCLSAAWRELKAGNMGNCKYYLRMCYCYFFACKKARPTDRTCKRCGSYMERES